MEQICKAPAVAIGEAVYRPASGVLQVGGEARKIEPRLQALLKALIEADGPVSRAELLDGIWGVDGSDEALTQAVSKLRRALDDTGRPHRIIVTEPKRGYRLAVAPRRAEDLSDAGALRDGLAVFLARLLRRPAFLIGLGAGVVAAGLAAALFISTAPASDVEIQIICEEGDASPFCAHPAD